ncbi:MAG: hypothetical protein ACRES1_07320, partial [Steroidobacteraceae bacterium]
AILGPRGEIVASAPPFEQYVLRSTVTPRAGLTPFARVGNWLIVSLAAAALAGALAMGALARARARRVLPPSHPGV